MNYKRIIFAVLLIPFVGLWEGATKGNFIASAASFETLSQALLLPSVDFDLSDLDVRDMHNRPVQTDSARATLTALFTENLFQIAVAPASREMQQVWELLDQFSHLFNRAFFPSARRTLETLSLAFQPSNRRFVHNVDKVWITFSVGGLRLSSALHSSARLHSVLHLPLRC